MEIRNFVVAVGLAICLHSVQSGEPEVCVVPPYADIRLSPPSFIPPEELDGLLLEGRCFLACLDRDPNLLRRVTTYPLWPFLKLKSNCLFHKIAHECVRGCSLWLNHTMRTDPLTQCPSLCLSDCMAECGGKAKCSNQDRFDRWLAKDNCQITCNMTSCKRGCGIAEVLSNSSFIRETGNTTKTIDEGSAFTFLTPAVPSLPLPPRAPPILIPQPLTVQTDMLGSYDISFREAAPNPGGMAVDSGALPLSASIFKIEDFVNGSVNYYWLSDPRDPLQLNHLSCRNVSISFAVLNQHGISIFSPTQTFQVIGDDRRIPNRPYNLKFHVVEDTRMGFFGYMRIQLSWSNPLNPLYLEEFAVVLKHSNIRLFGNKTLMAEVTPSENGVNSVTLYSENITSMALIIQRPYLVSIKSIGADGSRVLGPRSIITNSLVLTSTLMDFNCVRQWDGMRYFSFVLSWSIPLHWASTDVASKFSLSSRILTTGPSPSVLVQYGYVEVKMVTNRTYYRMILDSSGGALHFFSPQNDMDTVYRFELDVGWTNDGFTPPQKGYLCSADTASPPPSAVTNFTALSVTVHGINDIEVDFEWTPPAVANGVLQKYMICISSSKETPRIDQTRCDEVFTITGKRSSLRWNIYTEQCLYSWIIAKNEFVYGNWTGPLFLEGTCKMPPTIGASSASTDSAMITTLDTLLPGSSMKHTSTIISVVVILVFVCVVVCVFFVTIVLRVRRRRKLFLRQTEAETMFSFNPIMGRRPLLASPMTPTEMLLIDEWEVAPSEIIIDKSLGEGAFGEVYKGILNGPISCSKVCPNMRKAVSVVVAVKLLKSSAKGSERQDFLSEIELMKKVSEGHNPHVVSMLGCVTTQEPLCLLMEFVKYGDLLSYLRTNNRMCTSDSIGGDAANPYLRLGELSANDLLSFAYQIASGMDYLSCIGVVHRDLACRNILVDSGKVLRITDFGMSRETEDIYVQKSRGRVPFKWMAIESIITREFTFASDVWSYGIVLWEIGTLGAVPYPGIRNEDLLSMLTVGYRMEKPDNCSPQIYNIMLSCWSENSHQRPSFTKLRATFDTMLLAEGKGDYLDFSFDVSSTKPFIQIQDGETSLSTTSSLHFLNVSPVAEHCSRSHSSELLENTFKLLLNTDGNNGGCTLVSSSSDPSLNLGYEPTSPRQRSPIDHNHVSPRHQPSGNHTQQLLASSGQQSLKQHSPMRLFPSLQSADSQLAHSRLSFTASGNLLGEELGDVSRCSERPRPMSLLLSRERDRRKENVSDRYVKEPTKFANLNPMAESNIFIGGGIGGVRGGAEGGRISEAGGGAEGGRISEAGGGTEGGRISEAGGGVEEGRISEAGRGGSAEEDRRKSMRLTQSRTDAEHCILRRGSDGALNMNSNGYVSFVEVFSAKDGQVDHLQIPVTEDM